MKMKQSEVYGYNFPLNWDNVMDHVVEAVQRQIEWEMINYEPYERDIPMLAKSDDIPEHKVWGEVMKGIDKWCEEHIQII